MELYSSPWHILSAFFVFIFGFIVVLSLRRVFLAAFNRAVLLYLWHTLFCLAYLWYASVNGGDALGYFEAALSANFDFDFGTSAVNFLTAIIVQGLGLSLLGTFLVFNIFGSIGLLAFDSCLKLVVINKPIFIKRLSSVIIFLPSVSFWSSAIGKDSLSFMAICLALWAALNLRQRIPLMVFSITLMLLIRPHMAGAMLMALVVAILLDSRIAAVPKMLLGLSSLIGAIILVPFALQYAGVGDDLSAGSIMSYVEARQGFNMDGGGGIDIANMSLPMQLFAYMFRPVIFEARSIFAFAAAIDNTILVYLFILGLYGLLIRRQSAVLGNHIFMWTYVVIAWLILATTSANLGISIRQKWMFAPVLIFLLISAMKNRKPANAKK